MGVRNFSTTWGKGGNNNNYKKGILERSQIEKKR